MKKVVSQHWGYVCKTVGICLLFWTHVNIINAQSLQVITNDSPTNFKKSDFKLHLKSNLQSKAVRSDNDNSDITSINLNPQLQYKITKSLKTLISADLKFKSGFQQSIFDDNIEKSGIYLKDAYIKWNAFSNFFISGGAFNQGSLEAPLLISSSSTFTGTQQEIFLNTDNFKFKLQFQQLIPNSENLSTQNKELEPSPTFLTGGFKSKIKMGSRLLLNASGHYFKYSELPEKVAESSRLFGNTVPLSTDKFAYSFEGFASQISGKIRIFNKQHIELKYSYLVNTEAPEDINKGQIITAGLLISTSDSFVISPQVESFINQSDSSPAYYNDSYYGHNNRKGTAYKLDFLFKKSGYKISTSYVDSQAITTDLLEPEQKLFMINLEANYEIL